MNCPICNGETAVLSKVGNDRRRKCIGCGHRVTTTEVVAEHWQREQLAVSILLEATERMEALGVFPSAPAERDRPIVLGMGLIYFVQQDQTWAVKIGYTETFETLRGRIKTLQTASPYRLDLVHVWEGDYVRERALHRRFAASRMAGEWFRPCERMAEFFASCKAWQARHA